MAYANGSPGDWYISEAGGGQSIAAFDTFIGLQFKSGASLPVMPVEEGSFFAANKWMIPYNARIQLGRMGDNRVIGELMVALEKLKNSTDLVDIVTPYFTFIHGNIYDIDYDFSVDETGVGMATPIISIQEIRLIQISQTSTTDTAPDINSAKNPECNSMQNAGKQNVQESQAARDGFRTPPSGSNRI